MKGIRCFFFSVLLSDWTAAFFNNPNTPKVEDEEVVWDDKIEGDEGGDVCEVIWICSFSWRREGGDMLGRKGEDEEKDSCSSSSGREWNMFKVLLYSKE